MKEIIRRRMSMEFTSFSGQPTMEEIGIPAQCCCFGKDDIQWQVNPCSAGQYSQFTPSWAQRMGNIASNEASSIAKTWKIPVLMYQWKGTFWGFRIGPAMYVPIWKPYGPQLGPKLLQNGSKLGPSCAILEPSWAEVGANWSKYIGLKLGLCWPKMTPSRANVAAISDRNGAFWRFCADLPICKMCKLPLPVRFLATAPGRTWTPPSWSCTRAWQIGPFVPLAAKLPRLGTFGAGGFPSRSSSHFAGAKIDKSSRYMSLLQSCPRYDSMML